MIIVFSLNNTDIEGALGSAIVSQINIAAGSVLATRHNYSAQHKNYAPSLARIPEKGCGIFLDIQHGEGAKPRLAISGPNTFAKSLLADYLIQPGKFKPDISGFTSEIPEGCVCLHMTFDTSKENLLTKIPLWLATICTAAWG